MKTLTHENELLISQLEDWSLQILFVYIKYNTNVKPDSTDTYERYISQHLQNIYIGPVSGLLSIQKIHNLSK